MDWRLKALAFRALELPGGGALHYWLQRHVTKTWPRSVKTLDALAGKAQEVLAEYHRRVGSVPESLLEVGAGRDLAVPLALRGLGVKEVTAVDVNRIARLDLVQHAADRLLVDQVRFGSWEELQAFGVRYVAPHYVTSNDGQVDCSCSNEVLEHVPPEQLADLLRALRAVTRNLTVHSIDYSDHYARSDKSVSRLNFLRYSDEAWKPFNSGKQYVNRLRHSDYVRMFGDAGFTIIEESSEHGPPALDLTIAKQFERYDSDDLFAVRGRIVAV